MHLKKAIKKRNWHVSPTSKQLTQENADELTSMVVVTLSHAAKFKEAGKMLLEIIYS